MNEQDYSDIAEAQLDELEAGPEVDLYNDVLAVCETIFQTPLLAQSLSSAITTREGIRLRFPVPGHHPYKVFWSSEGPRIEAIFPHP